MADLLGEKLREAACLGDLYAIRTLISRNVNVNSQNLVNGWTALHWAVKRGHEDVVKMLLQYGANPNIENNKQEKPACLSTKPNISQLLGETDDQVTFRKQELDFIPNYLVNPPLFVDLVDIETDSAMRRLPIELPKAAQTNTDVIKNEPKNDLVIRARIKNSSDPDYIEFDMSTENITYKSLLRKCCEELGINENQIVKIKKRDVRIRNDADARRLRTLDYLDILVKD